jgi:hypothetical protein
MHSADLGLQALFESVIQALYNMGKGFLVFMAFITLIIGIMLIPNILGFIIRTPFVIVEKLRSYRRRRREAEQILERLGIECKPCENLAF